MRRWWIAFFTLLALCALAWVGAAWYIGWGFERATHRYAERISASGHLQWQIASYERGIFSSRVRSQLSWRDVQQQISSPAVTVEHAVLHGPFPAWLRWGMAHVHLHWSQPDAATRSGPATAAIVGTADIGFRHGWHLQLELTRDLQWAWPAQGASAQMAPAQLEMRGGPVAFTRLHLQDLQLSGWPGLPNFWLNNARVSTSSTRLPHAAQVQMGQGEYTARQLAVWDDHGMHMLDATGLHLHTQTQAANGASAGLADPSSVAAVNWQVRLEAERMQQRQGEHFQAWQSVRAHLQWRNLDVGALHQALPPLRTWRQVLLRSPAAQWPRALEHLVPQWQERLRNGVAELAQQGAQFQLEGQALWQVPSRIEGQMQWFLQLTAPELQPMDLNFLPWSLFNRLQMQGRLQAPAAWWQHNVHAPMLQSWQAGGLVVPTHVPDAHTAAYFQSDWQWQNTRLMANGTEIPASQWQRWLRGLP